MARLTDDATSISFNHRAAYATLTSSTLPIASTGVSGGKDSLSYPRPFGVVLKLTDEDFAKVAQREVGYRVTRVTVEILDDVPSKQLTVDAFTSAMGMELRNGPLPPTVRYQELLLEGLVHHGIHRFDGGDEYIDWVRSLPTVDVASDPAYGNTFVQLTTQVALTCIGLALSFAIFH